MSKYIYDIIIIGSGIAGLYSAFKIKKNCPNIRFLVLEKNKKQCIGGRWGNEMFHGTKIVTGAGVGRKKKDKLLLSLMKELNIPLVESTTKQYYAFQNPVNLNKVITFLKKKYHECKPSLISFEAFGKKHLTEDIYKRFVLTAGYSDYEKEDVKEVLYNYGMDDNQGEWVQMKVPWKEMVEKLISFIGLNHIKTCSEVKKIKKIQDENEKRCLFELDIVSGTTYLCNKVIVATTIDGIRKLVPSAKLPGSAFYQIEGQPFLRLYGKFAKSSIPILKQYVPGYTVVRGPLQKIIPINSDCGIYMIAYSDNKNAIYLKPFIENTEKNRNILDELVEKSLGIPKNTLHLLDIKAFYWSIGTHYYLPLHGYSSRRSFLNHVQHPEPGILVVGEVVSNDQGWSEGALDSVEKVVTKQWINNKNFC